MVHDPVLDAVARHDAGLHIRVLEYLLTAHEQPARAVAAYSGLPEALIRSVVETRPDLRDAIGRRADCPPDLLAVLGADPEESVRRSVAANRKAPEATLRKLAVDSDLWVRRDVFLNPNATDEMRAQIALSSDPEDLKPLDASPNDGATLSPDEIRHRVQATIGDPNAYRERAALASNPNLPVDQIPLLVAGAGHRWVWRSLWAEGPAGPATLWPSTWAFTSSDTPPWVIQALVHAGHPAGLLRTDEPTANTQLDPVACTRQLVISELLIRALWRELALADVIQLAYVNDSYEGDHFYPYTDDGPMFDAGTPTEYIIGGYSDSREWIRLRNVLDPERLVQETGEVFSNWPDDATEATAEELERFALLGSAYACDQVGLPIAFTPLGLGALAGIAADLDIPEDNWDMEVTVTDSALKDIGYANTSADQKMGLTRLLQASRTCPMLDQWAISTHFLQCMGMHPATPADVRSLLKSDPDPRVRESAEPPDAHTASRVRQMILLDRAQEALWQQDHMTAIDLLEQAAAEGDSTAMLLLAYIHEYLGNDAAVTTWLDRASATGSADATADLARLDIRAGDVVGAIERAEEIPVSLRTTSVWAILTWAYLIAGSSEGHAATSEDGELITAVLNEQPPVAFLQNALINNQLAFLANHVGCVSQHRALTDYETEVLEAVLSADEPYAELRTVVAYCAYRSGDASSARESLLLLSKDDIDAVRADMSQALGMTTPGSTSHEYFAGLLTMLDECTVEGMP